MGSKIEVKAHVLVDVEFGNFFERYNGWTYRDFKADENTLHKWVEFTTVMYCPEDGLIHCGLGRFDNDILYTFDRDSETFTSLKFHEVGEKFDVKVHRSLVLNSDGFIYGATALLHDINDSMQAPGGKIFRYKPGGTDLKVLDIPVPGSYIQSIALDERRQTLYGFTFMPERFFSYNIGTRQARDFGLIGSCLFIGQAHRPCVDDDGCVWGTWGSYYSHDRLPTEGHAINLLKYDPETDDVIFFPYGLLGPGRTSEDMIDDVINGKDGYLYIGGRSGNLYRLDPRKADIKCLGKPFFHQRRLSTLVLDRRGIIYGTLGDRDCTRLFRYDREARRFTELGIIYDLEKRQPAEKIHSLTITDDGVLFGGEIDNLHRCSFLWECKLND